MYPDSKSNYDVMYSRLLLFFPLKSESELNENNLREMYTRLTDDQDETIVNHNERKLFPMKIQKPTSSILVGEEDDTDQEVEAGDPALDALMDLVQEDDNTDPVEAGENALDALLNALEEERDDIEFID